MVAVRTLIRAFNSNLIIWGFCGRMIILFLRGHGFSERRGALEILPSCQDVFVQGRRLDSKTIRHFQGRGWYR